MVFVFALAVRTNSKRYKCNSDVLFEHHKPEHNRSQTEPNIEENSKKKSV